MIRFLQIVDNIKISSGVSSIIMNIYRNIDRNKVQFDFLVSNREDMSYENEIKSLGGQIFYSYNPLSVRTIIKSNKRNKEFFKENSNKYAIVHLHSATIGLFTLKYAKKYEIKNRIIHSHSSMTSPNKIKSYINTYLMYFSKKYANKYFSCSTEAANFLYGKNFCKNHAVDLICNAVDVDKFNVNIDKRNKMKNEFKLQSNKIIMHVSNYSKIKNVNFLLPIIKKTVLNDNSIKYVFIGDGPELGNFKNNINILGLDRNVFFIGRVRNVQDYLQMADLFLLPSLKEGLPVSLIEAQACGVKCITNETVTREANVGGVTYLPLDEEKWIMEILNASALDIDYRKHLSSKLKESNFNLKKEVNHIQNLYLNMVD